MRKVAINGNKSCYGLIGCLCSRFNWLLSDLFMKCLFELVLVGSRVSATVTLWGISWTVWAWSPVVMTTVVVLGEAAVVMAEHCIVPRWAVVLMLWLIGGLFQHRVSWDFLMRIFVEPQMNRRAAFILELLSKMDVFLDQDTHACSKQQGFFWLHAVYSLNQTIFDWWHLIYFDECCVSRDFPLL